jgi:type I restriction enzyme S subunit
VPKFFSLSPFDGAKFDALLGGLAITICKKSALENIQTIGSEYYLPDYVSRQSLVRASSPKVERLASVCSLITDGDHGVADYQDEGIQFVLSGNVKEGWIDTSDIRNISAEHHATLKRSSLKCGDVLVTKTGVYFGNSAVVPDKFGEANTIAHVGILRLKEAWNPYYVSTFLNSSYGYAQLRRRGMKATRPEIKLIEFNDIEIPFFGKTFEQGVYDLLQKAGQTRDLANQHYARTEDALLNALGLADWKPPEPLSYIASSADAFASGRLDAQYFMPAKRLVRNALSAMPGQSLGQRFDSIRDMFDPKGDNAPALVRNYDVTDALQPILDDDKPPVATEEIGSMKKVFKDGDVAISRLRAYLREIAVVRTSGALPSVGSSEFIVLRPRNNRESRIAPETLLTFLRSTPVQTILKWCQDGSQHPRFSEGDLLSIHVPDVVADASPQIEAIVKQGFETRRRAHELLDRAKRAVEIAIEDNEAAALQFLEKEGT